MERKRPKYVPDVAKVLRDYDPATFDERQRKALAKVEQAGLLPRLTPEPPERVSAPSPWVKAEAEGIDKRALPSAMMPAAPAEDRPVTKSAGPVDGLRRRWPRTWKLVLVAALVALAAPLLGVVLLSGRSRGREENAPQPAVPSTAGTVPISAATAEPEPKLPALPNTMETAQPSSPSARPASSPQPARKLPIKQRVPQEAPHTSAPPATAEPTSPPPPEPPPPPKFVQ